jgi:hypothetical protein
MKLLEVLQDTVSVPHYQRILDISNNISATQRKYIQGVLDSIKSKDGKVTPKQYELLQKLKKGDFKYHPKN